MEWVVHPPYHKRRILFMSGSIKCPLYRNINGEKTRIDPYTKGECVTMSDGRVLEDVIEELQRQINTLVNTQSQEVKEVKTRKRKTSTKTNTKKDH